MCSQTLDVLNAFQLGKMQWLRVGMELGRGIKALCSLLLGKGAGGAVGG